MRFDSIKSIERWLDTLDASGGARGEAELRDGLMEALRCMRELRVSGNAEELLMYRLQHYLAPPHGSGEQHFLTRR